jgi:signal transduction histidine kinase
VQTISGSIAASIETARLLAQEQQQRLIAESLSEVVAALAGSLDQETVIRTIFEQLQRVVRFSGAILYLRERNALVITEASGVSAHTIGRKLHLATDLPPQQVFKRKRPQIVSDPTSYSDWREQDVVGDIGSWMGAPLVISSKPIGVLAVIDSVPQTYNEQSVHTLQVFAHHAAIAIDNARRFRQAHVVAADEERSRLARELHDSVTQALFSASLISDVLPNLYRNNPTEAESGLETLSKLTHGALAEMRALLLELRPADMHQTRLHTLIGQLSTAAALQMPVNIKRSLDPAPPLLPKVQMALYRITQEALNNVIKHARADSVEISMQAIPPVAIARERTWQGTIHLTIKDNGEGFDQSTKPNGHMGLASMRERAKAIGADLRITTELGQGTQVALAWRGASARYRGLRAEK